MYFYAVPPLSLTPELINSIEITIAIDIFGTIAIAIVKRFSHLLLLLFTESGSSAAPFAFHAHHSYVDIKQSS